MVGAVAPNRPVSLSKPRRKSRLFLLSGADSDPRRGCQGSDRPGFFIPIIAPHPDLSTVHPVTALSHHKGLRVVALFEALKGAIVLIVGFGFLTLLGRDAELFAGRLVDRLHLNPANHYPHIFIEAMADLNNTRLWLIAGFAAAYATVRFVECYGLWHGRRWAEWFAALSGAIYVPVEVYEMAHRASWLKFGALVLNLAVVAYMVWLLTESRRLHAAARESGPDPATP